MNAIVLVFAGAGMGGVARHLVTVGCARACGTSFPWGTLVVNVIGSLMMGLLVGWLALRAAPSGDASQNIWLFLGTGVLGGFTTFSAFSLDAVALFEHGETASALGYVMVSAMVSIAALALGLALVRGLA